jgi:hypothetical protein
MKLDNETLQRIAKRQKPNHWYWRLLLDGEKRQYVEIKAKPCLDLQRDFTISLWVNVTVFGNTTILDRGIYGLHLRVKRYRMFPELCVARHCYLSNHPVEVKVDHHITAIFHYGDSLDDRYVMFVVNGVPDKAVETPQHLPKEVDYHWHPFLYIGANAHLTDSFDGHFFTGYLDDIAMWNRSLSFERARKLVWDVMDPEEEVGMVGYWHFNQKPQTHKGLLVDATRLNPPGIIHGKVQFVDGRSKLLVTVHPR